VEAADVGAADAVGAGADAEIELPTAGPSL